LRSLVDGDAHLDDRLNLIAAWSLVVLDRTSTLTPLARGERMAAVIPDARLVAFVDCAQSPNVERSERFNDLLRYFLKGRLLDDEPRSASSAVG